jgi:hypothetical protein
MIVRMFNISDDESMIMNSHGHLLCPASWKSLYSQALVSLCASPAPMLWWKTVSRSGGSTLYTS